MSLSVCKVSSPANCYLSNHLCFHDTTVFNSILWISLLVLLLRHHNSEKKIWGAPVCTSQITRNLIYAHSPNYNLLFLPSGPGLSLRNTSQQFWRFSNKYSIIIAGCDQRIWFYHGNSATSPLGTRDPENVPWWTNLHSSNCFQRKLLVSTSSRFSFPLKLGGFILSFVSCSSKVETGENRVVNLNMKTLGQISRIHTCLPPPRHLSASLVRYGR